jgi:hypothetical protein
VTSLGDYDEKEKFGISLNKGYSMKIEIRQIGASITIVS